MENNIYEVDNIENNTEYTIKLKGAEAKVIIRALQEHRQWFDSGRKNLEWDIKKHKEMIELLDGNQNNKKAKERLKEEKMALEECQNSLKKYQFVIKRTNMIIDKFTHIKE